VIILDNIIKPFVLLSSQCRATFVGDCGLLSNKTGA